jgi:PAS domain S-box-containing protein
MLEDISDTVEVDQRLRSCEERWELLVAVAEDGLWDWVPGTDEMYWSPQLTRMLGFEDGEIAACVGSFNALVHPDDHAGAWSAYEDHAAGKTAISESEFRLRTKDGSFRWIRSRGKAKFDEDGNVVRMVGLHTDITAQKQSEAEAAKMARQAAGSVDLPHSSAHCKTCKSDLLMHSRWRIWERPLVFLLHRPVRCRACGRRGFKPLWAGVPGRTDA